MHRAWPSQPMTRRLTADDERAGQIDVQNAAEIVDAVSTAGLSIADARRIDDRPQRLPSPPGLDGRCDLLFNP